MQNQRFETRISELISGFKAFEKQQLEGFAERSLRKFGLTEAIARDLVQEAVLAVIVGLQEGRSAGRHPREEDLADSQSFVTYLRGVVHSLAEAQVRRREHRYVHVPIDSFPVDCEQITPFSAPSDTPGQELIFRDFSKEFFSRLYARCPDRLKDMVHRWKAEAESALTIPLNGHHRRHRIELRSIARKVLSELERPSCQ